MVQGASVTFEPGARTPWHSHPLVQTLIVMEAAVGFSTPAAPSRRSGVMWCGSRPREALAWSGTKHGDDAYRDSGEAGWQKVVE